MLPLIKWLEILRYQRDNDLNSMTYEKNFESNISVKVNLNHLYYQIFHKKKLIRVGCVNVYTLKAIDQVFGGIQFTNK